MHGLSTEENFSGQYFHDMQIKALPKLTKVSHENLEPYDKWITCVIF